MFLSINTGLVWVDQWIGNAISGQLMVVFTLTIAAAERHCFGHILIYRHLHGVDARSLETLKDNMLELMSPIALLCLCSPLMGSICSMLLAEI